MILKLFTELNQDLPVDYVPQQKVKPDDKVVGVVGVQAQRLFSIIQRQTDLVVAKSAELKNPSISVGDMERVLKGLREDLRRLALAREVFWTEVREELGVLPDGEVLICEGWQVVAAPALTLGKIFAETLVDFLDDDCGDPNCPMHGHKHASQSAAD
jgi:hypothetical protein